MKTTIDHLPSAIQKVMNEWSNKVYKEMSESVLETAQQSLETVKENMPKGSKRIDGKNYIDCFKVLPNEKHSRNRLARSVWNEQYQLSHLLEDGHNVYTRPSGTKNTKGVRKMGPLPIKHRMAKGSKTSTTKDSLTTTSYNAWSVAEKLAAEYLKKNLTNRLVELKKKQK